MSEAIFVPKKTGGNYDLPLEIASLAPVQEHINLFTNFHVFKDAAPNLCHHSGWVILRSGIAPMTSENRPGETIDVTVARKIGNETRFRSLSATATGDIRDSFSYENGNSVNVPEWSPIRFYQRLFGDDFQDPNASEFTPDPRVLIRKSSLSLVLDETRKLNREVGVEDRARLDQYFTGLRDLERRFDLQLAKPDPREACIVTDRPEDLPSGLDAYLVSKRHRMMTDLMLMAIACDQTRVFNMFYASAFSATTKPGYDGGFQGRRRLVARQLADLRDHRPVIRQDPRHRGHTHVQCRYRWRSRQNRTAHRRWRQPRMPTWLYSNAPDGTGCTVLGRQEQQHRQ
jgi:hypothetical protein